MKRIFRSRAKGNVSMVNGQWSIVNGQWSMVNGQGVESASVHSFVEVDEDSCAIFQTVGEARKTQCFELLKHAAKVKLEEKYAYI